MANKDFQRAKIDKNKRMFKSSYFMDFNTNVKNLPIANYGTPAFGGSFCHLLIQHPRSLQICLKGFWKFTRAVSHELLNKSGQFSP